MRIFIPEDAHLWVGQMRIFGNEDAHLSNRKSASMKMQVRICGKFTTYLTKKCAIRLYSKENHANSSDFPHSK